MVETVLRPVSFFTTLLAAAWLVFQLRHVHDSTNLSRDIGLVGKVTVILLCEYLPMSRVFRGKRTARVFSMYVSVPQIFGASLFAAMRSVLDEEYRSVFLLTACACVVPLATL